MTPRIQSSIYEHLDLADFALERITCAVRALQDPERLNRPMCIGLQQEEVGDGGSGQAL